MTPEADRMLNPERPTERLDEKSARLEAEAAAEAPVCACCIFGNHTEICTCDGASCCHPAEHGAQRDRLLRRLIAVRAEAEGLAEAMANADRLYTEHLAEERDKAVAAEARIARARALLEDDPPSHTIGSMQALMVLRGETS
jgi:hypothetical protein